MLNRLSWDWCVCNGVSENWWGKRSLMGPATQRGGSAVRRDVHRLGHGDTATCDSGQSDRCRPHDHDHVTLDKCQGPGSIDQLVSPHYHPVLTQSSLRHRALANAKSAVYNPDMIYGGKDFYRGRAGIYVLFGRRGRIYYSCREENCIWFDDNLIECESTQFFLWIALKVYRIYKHRKTVITCSENCERGKEIYSLCPITFTTQLICIVFLMVISTILVINFTLILFL